MIDTPEIAALTERLNGAGVVCVGSGFPVAEKLVARPGGPVRTLIINAAQSEPLMHKDWALLAHFGACVFDGAAVLAEALGITRIFLAAREEFLAALPECGALARQRRVAICRLPDIYPLGYEGILKREILKLALGAAHDDVLVINAETLRNIAWAVLRARPVTDKIITVAGAVAQPQSLRVPIGASLSDCLALAGGLCGGAGVIFRDGVLGGAITDPAQTWVDATTLGFVALPVGHSATHEGGVSPMAISLSERRRQFLLSTASGRTLPMSAAYALFDLTPYRRARFNYRAGAASDFGGKTLRLGAHRAGQDFRAQVALGEDVVRGQLIGDFDSGRGRVRVHASVDGNVCSVDAQGIFLQAHELQAVMA